MNDVCCAPSHVRGKYFWKARSQSSIFGFLTETVDNFLSTRWLFIPTSTWFSHEGCLALTHKTLMFDVLRFNVKIDFTSHFTCVVCCKVSFGPKKSNVPSLSPARPFSLSLARAFSLSLSLYLLL